MFRVRNLFSPHRSERQHTKMGAVAGVAAARHLGIEHRHRGETTGRRPVCHLKANPDRSWSSPEVELMMRRAFTWPEALYR